MSEIDRKVILEKVEDWCRNRLGMVCELPCDSYGICQNCMETNLVLAGASLALKYIQELENAHKI